MKKKKKKKKKKQKKARSVGHTPGVLWLELLGERTRLSTRTLTSRLPNEIMGFREGNSRKRTSGNNHWAALSTKGWMDHFQRVLPCVLRLHVHSFLPALLLISLVFRSCHTADRSLFSVSSPLLFIG
jgi:hypothetical protein